MKTTTFLTITAIAILLFIWMFIHPERSNTGHLVVLILLCVTGIGIFPLRKKKTLPRMRPLSRLRWQVFGINQHPMKFYTEKVAKAYLSYLQAKIPCKAGRANMQALTPDRLHNPILVIAKRKLQLWEQFLYIRNKKDGRERIFQPNEQNCTSLLSKKDFRNPDLWAPNMNTPKGFKLSRYLSSS